MPVCRLCSEPGMRNRRILDPDALDRAFEAPVFLLFKHSPICPTSTRAWAEVESFLADHPETPSGWLDVIAERPLARAVAERTGVRHESPQILLLLEGRATWTTSHYDITRTQLEEAMASDA